jgi:hypothetical protein
VSPASGGDAVSSMAKLEAVEMTTAEKLRELAVWYREFAERAGNPMIWEARLRTAEDLEAEAGRVDAVDALAKQDDAFPLKSGFH